MNKDFRIKSLQIYLWIDWYQTILDIEIVFGNDTSFSTEENEDSHLNMLEKYISFAFDLRGKNENCECFFANECNGEPRELIDNKGIIKI